LRFKLDENLGPFIAEQLRAAGHDVATVVDQAMSGATDQVLFGTCRREERALVTLDVDFADPRRFDPATGAGIVVLRVPNRPSRGQIAAAIALLLEAVTRADVTGGLWIVEPGRVRRYETPDD